MDDADLFRETVAQPTGLVEVLGGLTEGEWDTPSLCAGWRVREVVAHITMPYRHTGKDAVLAMLKARGRFDVAADRLARRDTSQLSPADLLDCLRRNVAHPWKPPGGGGQLGALCHDVIHGLDITEALHVGPVSPLSRVATVIASRRLPGPSRSTWIPTSSWPPTPTSPRHSRPIRIPAKGILLICTARTAAPRGDGRCRVLIARL